MYILDTGLAQEIVTRTMCIIPFNVNVMDASGVILASGNPSRIGELHAGALLALAKKLTVEIDGATAKNLHGAQPGINLPLKVNGHICGAVGLSGTPDEVRQFGELVRLTAEMILEQANLTNELQRDSRYREAFVLNLIRYDPAAQAELEAWGRRLGINFERVQLAFLLELHVEAACRCGFGRASRRRSRQRSGPARWCCSIPTMAARRERTPFPNGGCRRSRP
jgi:carbohydrate diacid regulator